MVRLWLTFQMFVLQWQFLPAQTNDAMVEIYRHIHAQTMTAVLLSCPLATVFMG